ncbi:MAG: roadblock/LC7 domain-containing protein, partial [Actinomycetota bacterium]
MVNPATAATGPAAIEALVNRFATDTPGVTEALVVSADGFVLASCSTPGSRSVGVLARTKPSALTTSASVTPGVSVAKRLTRA